MAKTIELTAERVAALKYAASLMRIEVMLLLQGRTEEPENGYYEKAITLRAEAIRGLEGLVELADSEVRKEGGGDCQRVVLRTGLRPTETLRVDALAPVGNLVPRAVIRSPNVGGSDGEDD